MQVNTIVFPMDGYQSGRIVYAFIFSDRSVYVGITGTSNNTGIAKPFERLATHLRKHGNTFSVLHLPALVALREQGFRFCYTTLPPTIAALARKVEGSTCEDLKEHGYRVHNSNSYVETACNGSDAREFARQFAAEVARLSSAS